MTMNCKRRCSNSAEIIGCNDDLLTELLTLNIPAKQLLRLKLVNKQWNSLISTPSFYHRHTLHHHHPKPPPQPPSFLLNLVSSYDSPGVYYYYQPPLNKLILFRFTIPFSFIRIMQSCNGLLLLEAKNSRYGRLRYFVCNPTTMQFRDLSVGSSVSQQICLLFDPLKSPYYKVIRFTADGQLRPGREYTIDVYESETHSWKYNLGKRLTNNWQFGTGVYWNGGMYFIRSDANSYCFHLQDYQIGAEGRMEERVVDKPPKVPGRTSRRSIYTVESNGHLHSISLSLGTRNKCVYVYELNKEDHSWFEKFRVDLSPIAHVFVDKYPRGQGGIVFGFVRGETEEDSSFVIHQPGKIMLYRLNNRKSLEVLVDYTTEEYYTESIYQTDKFRCNDYYEFIETLAPV